MERVELPPIKTSYYMNNLSLNEEVHFEVSANTIIGEGEKTHRASTAPQERGTVKQKGHLGVIQLYVLFNFGICCSYTALQKRYQNISQF